MRFTGFLLLGVLGYHFCTFVEFRGNSAALRGFTNFPRLLVLLGYGVLLSVKVILITLCNIILLHADTPLTLVACLKFFIMMKGVLFV